MSRGGTQRTYSMWSLLGMFAVIGLVGLLGVLRVGSPRTPTVQLPGTQTLATTVPGESASGAGSDPTAPTTTAGSSASTTTPAVSTPPAVTVPGGAGAPEGVSDVLRTEDSTSFTFDVPQEMTSGSTSTAVPPARVVYSADGNAVQVSVSCAASANEVLALVSVTEDAGSVTVLAVVLVPEGGPPCDPAAVPREVTIPLAAPAAGRTLTVVPAGTAVSDLTAN